MKKLISFLLVIMMLCSMSVSAFAADGEPEAVPAAPADISTIAVGEATHNFKVDNNLTTASQETDLWLQVEASGQIDVTIPLLLVFKTNIDGGAATEATNYKLTNNNNANLVVTKIEAKAEPKGDNNPMTLVDWQNPLNEDEYKVKLNARATTYSINQFDLQDAQDTTKFDKAANEGGLFALNRTVNGTTGTDTIIRVDMETGKLSFVTTRTEDDTAMDDTQGVKLLTVTYTVAINTNNAYGEEITGEKYGTTGYEDDNTPVNTPVEYTYGTPAQGGADANT